MKFWILFADNLLIVEEWKKVDTISLRIINWSNYWRYVDHLAQISNLTRRWTLLQNYKNMDAKFEHHIYDQQWMHNRCSLRISWITLVSCILIPQLSGALGYWKWQAEHLAIAWCLHLHPINAIFYSRPPPYGRLSFLGKGFLLRCFQELS
jgi:hypothetical protein